MYARSITFQARPGVTTEQAAEIYRELILLLIDRDGFEGSTFMMNPETGHAISLTFWRDRKCATDAGPTVLPMLLVKVHALVIAPPEISGYEVIEHALAPQLLHES